MFSPDLMRHLIDPDKELDKAENRLITVQKRIFSYSLLSHEKVLSDYNFFFGFLHKIGEVLTFLHVKTSEKVKI